MKGYRRRLRDHVHHGEGMTVRKQDREADSLQSDFQSLLHGGSDVARMEGDLIVLDGGMYCVAKTSTTLRECCIRHVRLSSTHATEKAQ